MRWKTFWLRAGLKELMSGDGYSLDGWVVSIFLAVASASRCTLCIAERKALLCFRPAALHPFPRKDNMNQTI
jgi:hypothetical protein